MTIRGTTRICTIVGHPIAQVKSPELFNRRAETIGVDAALVPVDVHPDHLADFVALYRAWRNAAGFVVTVPHKRAVVPMLDVLTDRARRVQAVNVVRREADGTLAGDMVDGLGFIAAARSHGFEPRGKSALVVGTGGAGSAIVETLCAEGVARLALADIDPARVRGLRQLFAAAFPAVELIDGFDRLDAFDLVVNASPAGMNDTGEVSIPLAQLGTLRPSTLVADVVTKPAMTPLLVEAERRGCRIQTGPEMAAGQIEILGHCMGVFG